MGAPGTGAYAHNDLPGLQVDALESLSESARRYYCFASPQTVLSLTDMDAELVYQLRAHFPTLDLHAGDFVIVRPGATPDIIVRRFLSLDTFGQIPADILRLVHAEQADHVPHGRARRRVGLLQLEK